MAKKESKKSICYKIRIPSGKSNKIVQKGGYSKDSKLPWMTATLFYEIYKIPPERFIERYDPKTDMICIANFSVLKRSPFPKKSNFHEPYE